MSNRYIIKLQVLKKCNEKCPFYQYFWYEHDDHSPVCTHSAVWGKGDRYHHRGFNHRADGSGLFPIWCPLPKKPEMSTAIEIESPTPPEARKDELHGNL